MLLLIVAVTLLGHGALVLAQAQLDVSIAARAMLTARLSAEAGVVQAMAHSHVWPAPESLWRPQAIQEHTFGPYGRFTVSATAIDPELALWVGTGAHTAHAGTYRVGRMAWRLTPASRLAAAEGVVMSGGTLSIAVAATVDGANLSRPPSAWTEADCAPFVEALAWAVPGGRLPQWAVLAVDSGAVPPLGHLDGPALADRSRMTASGVITPRPAEVAGVCRVEDTSNWGDPSRAGGCRDHFVLATSSGDVTLVGGQGQGVLAVGGSLRLEGASRFAGVLLIAGDLALAQGARIDGLVRAGGSVSLSDSTRIVGSGCAVLAALDGLDRLQLPIAVSVGGWVSPLGRAH